MLCKSRFFTIVSLTFLSGTSLQAGQCSVQRTMAELEPEPMASGAGQRLGAPETLGISTLDPGHRPPAMPPGRHVTIRVRMLDDTEELFDISVSPYCCLAQTCFLVGILMPECDSSLLHNSQEAFPNIRHSSSSLVAGWHGNCMVLNTWINWRDLFHTVRILPVYCGGISDYCFQTSQTISDFCHCCQFFFHCDLLTTSPVVFGNHEHHYIPMLAHWSVDDLWELLGLS